jgi:aldehyde dehydrogenase
MTVYAAPGTPAPRSPTSPLRQLHRRPFVPPVKGQYFDVITPISGKVYTRPPARRRRHRAGAGRRPCRRRQVGRHPAGRRANLLLKIADRIEQNLELLAYAETVDNGKPIRETLNADIPLAVDHFRYFAGCLRAQEGALSEIDAQHHRLPLPRAAGRGRPDHPVELPDPDGGVEAGAGAGRRQLRGAEAGRSTPISILVLTELIADLLPPGVLNVVNGFGREAGMPLATSKRIAKIAFTGSTATGRVIAQAAATNLIPATLELGGKSPNIFFDDVMRADDAFLDKAIEGLVLFAFNQGEVCTCPSRALIQESIYDRFIERALKRVAAIKQGNPLDTDTMMGAQAQRHADGQDPVLPGGGQAGRRAGADRRRRPSWAATWPAATTSSPRCSRATTRCASSARRSSARCWP